MSPPFTRLHKLALITPEHCRQIIASVESDGTEWRPATENRAVVAEHKFVDDTALHSIASAALHSENEWWNFDLDNVEQLCVKKYTRGNYAKPHCDFGAPTARKISMVCLLSDPADYEGGSLSFGNGQLGAHRQGCATIYPAFRMHEVSPVTAGVRYVLITWARGADFR